MVWLCRENIKLTKVAEDGDVKGARLKGRTYIVYLNIIKRKKDYELKSLKIYFVDGKIILIAPRVAH